MNRTLYSQFPMLLRREMWESRHLFVASPLVLAGLMLIGMLWALLQVPEGVKAGATELLGSLLQSVEPHRLIMTAAIPFVVVLYICALIYLVNSYNTIVGMPMSCSGRTVPISISGRPFPK